MPKKDIHPEWYDNTEVYCDGKLVYTVSSTKEKLNVDIWSGNHPFYTGSKKLLDTEGRVDRFMKKYNLVYIFKNLCKIWLLDNYIHLNC